MRFVPDTQHLFPWLVIVFLCPPEMVKTKKRARHVHSQFRAHFFQPEYILKLQLMNNIYVEENLLF